MPVTYLFDVYYRVYGQTELSKWSGRAKNRSTAISFAPCSRADVRHVFMRPNSRVPTRPL